MKWLLSLSIRKQMLVLIIIMTIVPIGTIVYSALIQRRNDLREAERSVSRLVNEISNDQNALLTGTEQLFNVLSQLPAVQMHDKNAVNKLLTELVNKNPRYANLLIADRNGILWATAVPASGTVSYADRRYFQSALSSGNFSSGEYNISRTLHKPVMSYGAPIKDASGKITDVAIAAFTLEKYGSLISTSNLPEKTSILMTDHKGTILFVPTAPELVGKQDREDLFRRMTAGNDEGTFEAVSNAGIRRIFAYQKLRLKGENSPYMYVRAGIQVEAALAKTRKTMLFNVGLMSAILLLALGFAVYVSKRGILDKIIALRDASRRIADGNLDVRVTERVSGGELGELGHAFDDMAGKLARDRLNLQRADDAIREREGRLRAILDISQAGIFLINSRGRITFANRYLEQMLGIPRDELIDSSYADHVHPDEKLASKDILAALISGTIKHAYAERHYIKSDGSDFWGYLSCRRHEDDAGNLIAIVAVVTDITMKREAETRLKESEAKFRSIVDSSPAAMHFYRLEQDERLIFTGANPTADRMLGIQHATLMNMTIEEAFPNLRETPIPELYRNIARGELGPQTFETPYCDDQVSGVFDVIAFKTGQRDIAVNFMDISARKQSELVLREKEERYRELVEQSAAWIWETDENLRHVYSNRNVEIILGYRVEDFLAFDIFTILHADDHATARKLAEKAMSSHEGWKGVVLRWKHQDGSWKSIQTTGNPRLDSSGRFQGLRGIDLDITDKVRLQEEMERAQRLESIGILAGGIAHDFNNILTGIMGNISFARNSLEYSHEASAPLARAEKASRRAANLARQLLIFAKGGQPVKKVFSLRHALHEALSLVLSGTKVKGVIDLPDSLQAVEADEGQISQSLHNIIINAVQAMPDGGSLTVSGENVTLDDNNECRLAGGEYVKLSFADEGCGIAAAEQKKIFDPYFTTKTGGTGLGLASTYAIINSHGGGIFVCSSPGEGTTFMIYLPASREIDPEQPEAAEPAAVTHEEGTVLVMDDEEMVRELAQLTLGRRGYTVKTCSNGHEAITLYKSARESGAPFSVVIMDLTIPGSMGGVETARQILAYDPGATLIVSSGYSEDPVMANYRDYGFCAAIEKPYKSDDIARAISSQRKQSASS